jgi:APA family basic amino acid/polyamine antiporter
VPFGPILVPALGVLSCVGMIIYLPPTSWVRFGVWLVVGLTVYGLYSYRHSLLRRDRSLKAPVSPESSPTTD